MKILAFSDYRVHSPEIISHIIQDNSPDLIFYAGDDLGRVVPLENNLYLKTDHHFLNLNENIMNNKELFVVNRKNKLLFSELMEVKLKELRSKKSREIEYNNIPFFFVNGNDEILLEQNGKIYIKASDLSFILNNVYYTIQETSKHKITIREIRSRNSHRSETSANFKSGIYFCFNKFANFGYKQINEELSYYGLKCSFGKNSKILNCPEKYTDIYLSHLPPKGVLDLSVRFGIRHVGSDQLRTAIQNYHPKFVICGHSHFWGGKSDKLGETIILNVSSPDSLNSEINYALIDSTTDSYEIKKYRFKNLRQIRGAGWNIRNNIEFIKSYDFFYQHNLLERKNKEIIKQLEDNNKTKLANRIKSIEWEKPLIIKKITFNPKHYALVDIETGLPTTTNFGETKWKLWLIGILYKGIIQQFEFPKQKEEFINFIRENNIRSLVSWTNFDSKILRRLKELKDIKWIDACQRVANCIIWHSYKLHELYDALFNNKVEGIIDGEVAGIYADHIINNKKICEFCPSEETVKNEIKARNKIDLIQMHIICEFLWNYEEQN